jgi:hypothetical protein
MPFDSKNAELTELLSRLCDGDFGQADCERLESLLLDDPAAQDFYRRFMALDVELSWRAAGRPAPSQFDSPASIGIPPITIEATPDLHASDSAFYPMGGFAFSYAAALVIVGIGLLIGWAYQVSTPRPDQRESVYAKPPVRPTEVRPDSDMVFVARVTDMVECRWADPSTGTIVFAHVPLNRKYALASGLMEITYNTGAKVILQGPCVYEVKSRTSGFLSQGRLTVLVKKKPDGDKNPANQQSTIINQQSTAPLFVVRTPTAKVTDLGTEFAVEVDRAGVSTAFVYDGKIELLAVGGAAESTKVVRLEKGQSARVEVGADRVARVVRQKDRPSPFVRRMPNRMRITVFNTGVNLKEGDPDPHWQLVARSDNPKFKPRPAVVANTDAYPWLSNQLDRSQWISAAARDPFMPDGIVFTFRTAFDLKGMRASTAVLHGGFVVDNHVRAIRLNGREVPVPKHGYEEFGFFHGFSADRAFVEGVNVLEVDVENGIPGLDALAGQANPMGLLVELDGSALSAWPEPAANVSTARRKQEKSKD